MDCLYHIKTASFEEVTSHNIFCRGVNMITYPILNRSTR